MNTPNSSTPFKLTGDWDAQSKDLKTKYTELTDADLKFEPNGEKDLIQRVQARLKKNHSDVVEILRSGQVETK